MSACRPFAEGAFRAPARVALMTICCVLLASCGLRQSRILAQRGVKEFHTLLDREEYTTIWDRSDDSLKKSWTRTDFIAYLRNVHSRLGASRKTDTKGFQVNAVAGQSTEVALAMETEFDSGLAEERFLWRLRDDHAVLVDYRADIKSSTGPTTV